MPELRGGEAIAAFSTMPLLSHEPRLQLIAHGDTAAGFVVSGGDVVQFQGKRPREGIWHERAAYSRTGPSEGHYRVNGDARSKATQADSSRFEGGGPGRVRTGV